MSKPSSYRQILHSSSLIGGASVANILIGLLRMKAAAVLLGPAGIGLIGLMQNLVTTASSVAAVGVGMSGTRQIAEARGRDDEEALLASRRALSRGGAALAAAGAALFWLAREPIANWAFGGGRYADEVGWLAIGVAFSVLASAEMAALNGLRRIGDIARTNVLSALVSTAVGLAMLLAFGRGGVVAFVLAMPLASFAFAKWYAARLPRPASGTVASPAAVWAQWGMLLRLGMAFMLSGLVLNLGQLLVRVMVQRRLGEDALGQFQAAWLISMTYIGFVLGAMAADYYPRLTALIHDKRSANRLVNQQSEVALLLAAPVVLAMLGLAPWILRVLYSGEFVHASSVLRWQILGDVLKLASWPLGFVMLAAGQGRLFVLAETFAMSVFAGTTWLLIPRLGLEAAGVAFLCMYALYLPTVYWLAWRRTGFSWRTGVIRIGVLTLVAAGLVHAIASQSAAAGLVVGLLSAALFAAHAAMRLRRHVEFAPAARLVSWLRSRKRG